MKNCRWTTLPLVAVLAGAALLLSTTAAAQQTRPQTRSASESGEAPTTSKGSALAEVQEYIRKLQSEGRIVKAGDSWKQRLPEPPQVSFEGGETYFWHLDTNMGAMKLRFHPEAAPRQVANFLYLTELGYFDGVGFHRVIPGFMAQGGDPTGTGRGNPGYGLCTQTSEEFTHDSAGVLAMAKPAQPACREGSQFYITFQATAHLDGNYTVFGKLVDGMETLKKLEERGSRTGRPTEKLTIESARISVE